MIAVRILVSLLCLLLLPITSLADEATNQPIVIGLDADMSGGSAQAGESIRRGALIAIQEINKSGGVLNRKLMLRVMDHRGNPARGVNNIEELAADKNVVAVLSGLHTPVALHELKSIHKHKLPYLVPWAAGTPIIDNGYKPNFAFRLSVRDQYAGGYLVKKAKERGHKRIGLLLERTGWGESNERAMKSAIKKMGLELSGVEWFLWGTKDFSKEISSLIIKNTDVILLVANAPEGAAVIKSLAKLQKASRLPVISHWGITGGKFSQLVGDDIKAVKLAFLQTYSFLKPTHPDRAKRVLNAYCIRFNICQPERIKAPVGAAHAYDLVHILAKAIKNSGHIDREKLRDALERVTDYKGLVRDFASPFTATRHDALNASDFQLGRYTLNGEIHPIED